MENSRETYNSFEEVLKEYEALSYSGAHDFRRFFRLKAFLLSRRKEEELNLILHLVESHMLSLRLRAEIEIVSNSYNELENSNILTQDYLSFSGEPLSSLNEKNINTMLERISEMPKEWTVVQITPLFNIDDVIAINSEHLPTNGIHLTVFNCGEKKGEPYCITINTEITLSTREEMRKIEGRLKETLSIPQKTKSSENSTQSNLKLKRMYHRKKAEVADSLQGILYDLENCWLGPWRCLLIGKCKNEKLEKEIKKLVKQFLVEKSLGEGTKKTENILVQLFKAMCEKEFDIMLDTYIEKILEYCFPGQKLKNPWLLFWKDHQISIEKEERYPLILIVDETLDALPWEMIRTLKNHPTSRMPSIHLLYAVFKVHEDSIVDGYKVISQDKNGKFILNPGKDLGTMEVRMKAFFDYWLPEWKGIVGQAPSSKEFIDFLTSADIFSYSGHGSGVQYCSSDKIHKKKIDSCVFLFGCGSTQLKEQGRQVEMHGVTQMYLLAACPCIVGMLWVVSDLDSDILTTTLLSTWIPNTDKSHWKNIILTEWADKGKVVFNDQQSDEDLWEADLLKALSKSKNSMKFLPNRAAVVARGIPVKLLRT